MTKERAQAEIQTAEAIERILCGEDDKYLRAAAWSYARGLRDGARIMAQFRPDSSMLPGMMKETAV